MSQKDIAIIGAGPKAAAIAAKAHCLNMLDGQPKNSINIVIIEKLYPGSAWSGSHGYTDGDQPLCTPAERDFGFPYSDDIYPGVAELMQQKFSWNAYLISEAAQENKYADWINRGRKPPSHRDFSEYLKFALDKAEFDVLKGEVLSVEKGNPGRWSVVYKSETSKDHIRLDGLHGVVFTGPGPSTERFKRVKSNRIYNGQNFWSRLSRVKEQLSGNNKRVVVIGGGGTTAAVTAWFVRSGISYDSIMLLNSQATLFSRSVNFFESRIFDDEETWKAFSKDERRSFSERLNRGVVWENVTEQLSNAKKILLIPGKASSIGYGPKRTELKVNYTNASGDGSLEADVVIDAAGFDPWWFSDLLPAEIQLRMADSKSKLQLENGMRDDLSFRIGGCPPIHAPMHSQVVGPGYMSLMVLGGMADRILRRYL